ncbi:MAG: hypothetical protein IKQ33_04800 [Clostridia bacterium]|nr:hypothetical protein [Clostridia bacterium]
MQYNETITQFFSEMNIDKSIENNTEAICYNKREINTIIARYGMYKNKQNERICIADVIGKDRGKSQNILAELNGLFDRAGESYKKRSVSMLQYHSNEIINKLSNSFKVEPIELKEIKLGKYIVGNNGMHRVNLLKVHYLNECKNCNNRDEITVLNEKYTIDVILEKLDVIKTYSKYVLSLIDKNLLIEDEIDYNYQKTGNVIMYDENEGYRIYNNAKLAEYVKNRIGELKNDEGNIELIQLYKSDEYFKEYLKLISLKELFDKLKLDK